MTLSYTCPQQRPTRPSCTQRIIREPQGLAWPNVEGMFPTSDATRLQVSSSKGQRSVSPGPLMLTHIVCHIFRMASLQRQPASVTCVMTSKVKGQGHKVSWSVWALLAQWPTNRNRIVVVSPKLARGYPMTCAALRTSFKVKRSKVGVTGRLTQTHKMCDIFRTVRPKNFKLGMRMKVVDPHQRQVPWPPRLKVKVISSHRLYVSSLPLVNSGNKMLYLCH